MDAHNERVAVSAYLDGKDICFGAEVAREAWGRKYDSMSVDDWRRLAGHVLACGFRSTKVGKVACWVKL